MAPKKKPQSKGAVVVDDDFEALLAAEAAKNAALAPAAPVQPPAPPAAADGSDSEGEDDGKGDKKVRFEYCVLVFSLCVCGHI